MSEKCVPLNLDLTCLQVNSSLEESLLTANNVLQLVKSVEPDIITIQCHVTEESLDYLLFNKLPGNCYDKKYVRSSGRNTGQEGREQTDRQLQTSRGRPTLWWPGGPQPTPPCQWTSAQWPPSSPSVTWPAPAWCTCSQWWQVVCSLTLSCLSPRCTAGPPALTVISWAGLDCSTDNKERTLYFETFIRFVGAFRSLNNLKLRILIGGLFNVDLKVIQV